MSKKLKQKNMLPQISMPEILIIGGLLFIFFGKDKLPDAAKSLGKSFKILKDELNPEKLLGTKTSAEEKPAELKTATETE